MNPSLSFFYLCLSITLSLSLSLSFSAMIRLQDRIGELHVETDEERIYLREMHKERIRLNKDKQS